MSRRIPTRVTQGGTQKFCPKCNRVQICKAKNPSTLAGVSGQRFYQRGHVDVQYFRRALECSCGHEFLTAERPEKFVDELVELRDALAAIKKNAETYAKESKRTARSLKNLTQSLNALRALKVIGASDPG